MTDYVLPRTESGEVDWDRIKEYYCRCQYHVDLVDILKSIDATARADEREQCRNSNGGVFDKQ